MEKLHNAQKHNLKTHKIRGARDGIVNYIMIEEAQRSLLYCGTNIATWTLVTSHANTQRSKNLGSGVKD